MAVFMMNICKYRGCGLVFPSLVHLIQHIEDTHIDNDPKALQQKESSQPSCIPLSYVLRFFTESSRREFLNTPAPPAAPRRRLTSAPKSPPVRSNTPPTGSDFDDDEMNSNERPSEDSNDSWTTVDEYSSDFILRHGIKMTAAQPAGPAPPGCDKPFACPVPGCKKRYKNINGIKYHSKNGHKKDGKIRKGYRCPCGKSYKSAQGLKTHSSRHNSSDIASPNIEHRSVKMPGLVVTAARLPRTPGPLGPSGPLGPPGSLGPSSGPLGPSGLLGALDALDTNQLVRIYDSLTPKDIPSLIPKKSNPSQIIPGILTPNTTPETSPQDKMKSLPKLTVHSGPPQTKELTYIPKSY